MTTFNDLLSQADQFAREAETRKPSYAESLGLTAKAGLHEALAPIGQALTMTARGLGADRAAQYIQGKTQEHLRGAEQYRKQRSGGFNVEANKPFITDEGEYGGGGFTTALAGAIESAPGTVAMLPIALGTYGAAVPALAARGIGQTAAKRIALGLGASIAEGPYAGLQNAAQQEFDIQRAPIEQLRGLPSFQKALNETDTALGQADREAIARDAIARDAGMEIFGRTALATGGIAAALPGFTSTLVNPVKGGLFQSLVKQPIKGFAEEATQEALQSSEERVIENIASQKYLDPTRTPFQGALNAAASGAASGGLLGAVGGAAGAIHTQLQSELQSARKTDDVSSDSTSIEEQPKQSEINAAQPQVQQPGVQQQERPRNIEPPESAEIITEPPTQTEEQAPQEINQPSNVAPDLKTANPFDLGLKPGSLEAWQLAQLQSGKPRLVLGDENINLNLEQTDRFKPTHIGGDGALLEHKGKGKYRNRYGDEIGPNEGIRRLTSRQTIDARAAEKARREAKQRADTQQQEQAQAPQTALPEAGGTAIPEPDLSSQDLQAAQPEIIEPAIDTASGSIEQPFEGTPESAQLELPPIQGQPTPVEEAINEQTIDGRNLGESVAGSPAELERVESVERGDQGVGIGNDGSIVPETIPSGPQQSSVPADNFGSPTLTQPIEATTDDANETAFAGEQDAEQDAERDAAVERAQAAPEERPQVIREPWEDSPLLENRDFKETGIQTQKQEDGQFAVLNKQTQTDFFPGQRFATAKAARDFFRAQRKLARAVKEPQSGTLEQAVPEQAPPVIEEQTSPSEVIEQPVENEQAETATVSDIQLQPPEIPSTSRSSTDTAQQNVEATPLEQPTREAWESSVLAQNPDYKETGIETAQNPDGSWKIVRKQEQDDIFPGRSFPSKSAARQFFRDQRKLARAAKEQGQAQPAPSTDDIVTQEEPAAQAVEQESTPGEPAKEDVGTSQTSAESEPIEDKIARSVPKPKSVVADHKLPKRVGGVNVVQSVEEIPEHLRRSDMEGIYDLETGLIYIVADNVSKRRFQSVLRHELYHRARHTDPSLHKALQRLDRVIERSFNRAKRGKGSALEKSALKSIEDAGTPQEHQLEEYQAYLVSEYNLLPVLLRGWFSRLRHAVRAALIRAGVTFRDITPGDLDALARYGSVKPSEFISGIDARYSVAQSESEDLFRDVDARLRQGGFMKRGIEDLGSFIDRQADTVKRNLYGIATVKQTIDFNRKFLPTLKSEFLKSFKAYQTELKLGKDRAMKIVEPWILLDEVEANRLADVINESTLAYYDHATRYFDSNIHDKTKTDEIQKKYDLLSEDAQNVYKSARDYHVAQASREIDRVIEIVQHSDVAPRLQRKRINQLRRMKKGLIRQGPYFNLYREGDYWVATEDQNGVKYFEKFLTERQRSSYLQSLDQDNERVIGSGTNIRSDRMDAVLSPEILEKIDGIVQGIGESQQVNEARDALHQLYLKTLPSHSTLKNYIHRKGRRGFSHDALKAFSHKSFHDAYRYAKMLHGYDMRKFLSHLKIAKESAESENEFGKLLQRTKEHKDFVDNPPNALQLQILRNGLETMKNALQVLQTQKIADPSNQQIQQQLAIAQEAYDKVFEKLRQDETWLKDEKDAPGIMTRRLSSLESMVDMAKRIRARKDGVTQATILFEELSKAVDHVMGGKSGGFAQAMTTLGFGMTLGANISGALVNGIQVPGMTLPALAAEYGIGPATKAIAIAYKEFWSNRKPLSEGLWSIEGGLDPEQAQMFQAMLDAGELTQGQAYELAGYAEGGFYYNPVAKRVMDMLSYMYHHAERMNREVTALATFNLERARQKESGNPLNIEEALAKVYDTIDLTQGDYLSANAARFMRSDLARILLQFKKYPQMVFGFYVKAFREGFMNDPSFSPEEKVIARKMFRYAMLMQLGLAGALGLPLGGLYALLGALGDSDDEPFDLDAEFTQLSHELFGDIGGEAVSHGVINAFTPFDLFSRLRQDDLLARSPTKELEGKDAYYYWLSSALGPVVGGTFANIAAGADVIEDGHTMRGIEQMVPSFIRNIMQAGRFASEGALTLRGDELIDDPSWLELLGKASGFGIERLSRQYLENNTIKNYQKRLQDRSTLLKSMAINAKQRHDPEAYEEAMAAIRKFGERNPTLRITAKDLQETAKRKATITKKVESGVYLPGKYADLRERFSF